MPTKTRKLAAVAGLTALTTVVAAGCGSPAGGPSGAQAPAGNGHILAAPALGVSLRLPAGWISVSYGTQWLIGHPLPHSKAEVDQGRSHMTLEPIPGTLPDVLAAFGQGAPQQNLTINGHSFVKVSLPQPNYDIVGQATSVFVLAVSPVGTSDTAGINAIVNSLRVSG